MGTTTPLTPRGRAPTRSRGRLNVPQAGTYEVFVRYPGVSGAATNARFTVVHAGGSTVRTVNQTTNTGSWVSLGSFAFAEGNTHRVSLSDQAGGTVLADAVKLVRDNTGEADAERHDHTYRYDPNGNLTTITDASPGARIDTLRGDLHRAQPGGAGAGEAELGGEEHHVVHLQRQRRTTDDHATTSSTRRTSMTCGIWCPGHRRGHAVGPDAEGDHVHLHRQGRAAAAGEGQRQHRRLHVLPRRAAARPRWRRSRTRRWCPSTRSTTTSTVTAPVTWAGR